MTRVFRTRLPQILPSTKKYFRHPLFFLLIILLLSFSSHAFSWACRSLCEPRKFFSNSLFVHSFVCAITHLFLNGFQPNFYQHFSHVCPTYLSYYFQPVKTLESICDRLLHCKLTVTITWTPSYDLHKISDTQSILMYHSVLQV